MTISPQRLANYYDVQYCGEGRYTYWFSEMCTRHLQVWTKDHFQDIPSSALRAIADHMDSIAANPPEISDSEPLLPPGFIFKGIDQYGAKYLSPDGRTTFHPSEKAVAEMLPVWKHAAWAYRQPKPAPVPEVSDEMVLAAVHSCCGGLTMLDMRKAIQAALAAHHSTHEAKL